MKSATVCLLACLLSSGQLAIAQLSVREVWHADMPVNCYNLLKVKDYSGDHDWILVKGVDQRLFLLNEAGEIIWTKESTNATNAIMTDFDLDGQPELLLGDKIGRNSVLRVFEEGEFANEEQLTLFTDVSDETSGRTYAFIDFAPVVKGRLNVTRSIFIYSFISFSGIFGPYDWWFYEEYGRVQRYSILNHWFFNTVDTAGIARYGSFLTIPDNMFFTYGLTDSRDDWELNQSLFSVLSSSDSIYSVRREGVLWLDYNPGHPGAYFPHFIASEGDELYAYIILKNCIVNPDEIGFNIIKIQLPSLELVSSIPLEGELHPNTRMVENIEVDGITEYILIFDGGIRFYGGDDLNEHFGTLLENIRIRALLLGNYDDDPGREIITLTGDRTVTMYDILVGNEDVYYNDTRPVNQLMLSAAYPNPFNTRAVIEYSLPVNGVASVSVFDQLGAEVARLRQGWQLAGSHTLVWNAAGMPSGTYLLKLSSARGEAVRAVQLIK